MKVQIDGNVIDSALIYRIGEIETLRTDSYDNVIHYGFCICFLDKNDLKISLHISDSPLMAQYKSFSENRKDLIVQASAEILERITNCRNKLIEIWKENQSCIPEIKL